MSDIVRSAITAKLIQYPLSWRKTGNLWTADAGGLKLKAWQQPSDTTWKWNIGRDGGVVVGGQVVGRREAMDAAEEAARALLPKPTDVQIVTGWLALRSEVPDEVLAAGLRLAERDKEERKTKKPAPCQGGGG